MWSLICLLNLVGTFLWSNMASWSFSPLVKFAWKMIKRNLVCATDYQRVSSNWSPLIAESPLITMIKRLSINDHYYTTINKHDSPCWTTQHSSSSIVYCSSKRHILGMCFFVPSFFFLARPEILADEKNVGRPRRSSAGDVPVWHFLVFPLRKRRASPCRLRDGETVGGEESRRRWHWVFTKMDPF